MNQHKLDTVYSIETPESIDLATQLAGPVPRIFAYFIDLLIKGAIIFVLSIALAIMGNAGVGILLIITFLLEWFYPVFFEIYYRGQTPGKKSLKITVVNTDLTPVTWNSSIVRNLLRTADFLPTFYVTGIISMTLSSRFQRLGDIAAGTIVVYRDSETKKTDLPEVDSQVPPFQLSLDDQVAIVEFTQRHKHLTIDRQIELANILSDATNKKDKPAVEYLQGIGCWLLGDRK